MSRASTCVTCQGECSTVETDHLVPIIQLKSDILPTESLSLLTEGTYADSLLTALPVLSEEEQQALSATPAHPSGLYGFFTKFATIVGGPMVGKAMDHVPRVQANNFLNIAHASCLIRKLPSEIWFFLKKDLISSI